MVYYKVIQNDIVIDVGFTFLEWNKKYNRAFYCGVDKGQFVGSIDGNTLYRDTWMKLPPEEATGYKNATVVIIKDDEYIDLYKKLAKEETVVDTTDMQVVTFDDNVETEIGSTNAEPEETVFTMSEMRKMLLEQQEKINKLTELLESKNE